MSKFLFPGFASLTEFLNGKTGDCGPDALLMCLHVRDEGHWPLTAAGLRALLDDMAARGCLMADNGMTNIPGLDRYLTLIGVPHHTVGYGAFTLSGLHEQLKSLAGPSPKLVLVEWSAAGAGLHDDEPGVKFHFSAFGGIYMDGPASGWGYYRGDGDSRTDDRGGKPSPAIVTGWPSIAAAKPIGYIVIEPAPPPAPKPDPRDAEIAALKGQVADLGGRLAKLEAGVTAAVATAEKK